jgi:hypothetical protein
VCQEPNLKGRVGEGQLDSVLSGQRPSLDYLYPLPRLLYVEHAPDFVELLPASCGLIPRSDGLLNYRERGTAFAFLDFNNEVL